MYCPRCGQQQVSDEMKFCSRCGLPISGLTEWLTRAGVPAKAGKETQISPSPRRKGIRRAAKLMFVSGVLLPVSVVVGLAVDDPSPLIVPFIVFFVALIWMLYARLFGQEILAIKSQHPQTAGLGSMSTGNALPSASNNRINGVGEQQVRTKELAQPPSVTERTTKLLEEE